MTYEQWLVGITYTVIGAITVLCAVWIIGWMFDSIITTWKNKKYVQEKQIHRLCITGIRDWCGYEFPQVDYATRHILDVLDNKIGHSDDWFREGLRRGEYIREGTWEWACKMMEEGHIVNTKSQTGTVKYKLDSEKQGRILWNFDKVSPDASTNASWTNANIFLPDFKRTDWQIFE